MNSKKMAVFCGVGQNFKIREEFVSLAAPGTVGLSLISSGICGTDVHIHQGYLGMPDMEMVIGHEFIGEIDQIGENAAADALGDPLQKGDNVIACVAVPCGKCFNCQRGETASCLAFGVTYVKPVSEAPHFHGGFAEYLFCSAKNTVKLPGAVNPFAAAAFPCGGPTVIRSCEYGGGLNPGEIVVIQGNGSLGIFALAYAKTKGCVTVVAGSAANAGRAAITKELKPDYFFDYRKTSNDELSAKIKEIAGSKNRGDGADVVIETSGSHDAFPLGLQLLRTRGRYFVPGQYSDRGTVAIPPHMITFRALQIFGSGQYTMADIKTYLDFLEKHPELQQIFVRMIKKYKVANADEAMADAAAGNVIKAVFVQ